MTRNRPLIYTACNSAAQFIMGMVTAQKGPSFNDLILISNTDVEGGSFYITASNFGFMLGSLLAGALYGRIKTKSMTIAIAMMFSGLLTTLVPQCTSFLIMFFMQAFVSLCSSVYETSVSAEEIEAWSGSSESAMQFLGFCYSIGAMIAPIITRPFLAPKPAHTNHYNESSLLSSADLISSIPNEIFDLPNNDSLKIKKKNGGLCSGLSSNCTSSLENNLVYNFSTNERSLNQILESDDVTSNLQYAYLITGVASIILSIPFYALCVYSFSKKLPESRKKTGPLSGNRNVSRATSIRLVALVSAFYFFHAMGIDSFGQYLFYFLVTHLDWSKVNGAYLMSLYWALGIPLKLLMVVIYKRVKVGNVLLLCNSGIVVFIILFVLASQFHIDALAWVSCSGVALSHASIFGSGLAWTDGNLIRVDGKVTSVLNAFACTGALSAPLLLGVLMKNWSLMLFPYCVLVQVSISAAIFMVMLFVVKPAMDRKYGPLRPHEEQITVSEDNASDAMVTHEGDNMTEKNKSEAIEII